MKVNIRIFINKKERVKGGLEVSVRENLIITQAEKISLHEI